jgi:lipopolysaccharide export system permease protein
MMIFWRYALHNYLRVFLLSIATFIAILLIARFKDISRFTAVTGDFSKTGLFIFYQIPSILPITIPISALITSSSLLRGMSRTFELTALRASGLSLFSILSPILACSLLLSIVNFSVSAQFAPSCRRASKMLFFQETSQNPLLLLQRQKLVNLKHSYLDMRSENEETVKDLVLITYSANQKRLNLLCAEELNTSKTSLLGKNIGFVSYLPTPSGVDTLLIENQKSMETSAEFLSKAMKRTRPRLDVNGLDFKMLQISAKKRAAQVEMLRRISLSMAVFSFTLLGAAFGIEQGRNPSPKNLFFSLLLTMTVLLSYLLAKELKSSYILSICAFLVPHPFIWLCSTIHLFRISKGKA